MTRQREVRLGLVLYGGVSLAVYENGIAQEFYRAIKGQGVYGLLQDLTDSDIIVDIISGTSAGGVNGIMLGHALANKCDFTPSADLWRNQADIQQLLRKESDPDTDSVLDSGYYQDKLQECYAFKLIKDPNAPDIDELDLFITGTDANGNIYTVYDDEGHAIDVKNHRALFKLSFRSGRKNDFHDASPEELGKLSRLTSCFPVAFQPVRITPENKNFFRWGNLSRPAVYMDGGILNNKPFTSTIDDIFRRTANRDVERFLIYVEPAPENFAKPPDVPPSPTVVQAAASALLSIPGYQSIAADLEEIDKHNRRAQRVAEILDSLGDAPQVEKQCLDTAAVAEATPNSEAYYAARFIQLRDAAVESILNDPGGRAYFNTTKELRAGRLLVESFRAWKGDKLDGMAKLEVLAKYDVYFRKRRASRLSHALMARVKQHHPVPAELWDVINHYFKLYEIVEWAMRWWLDKWRYDWRSLDGQSPAELSTEVWRAAAARLDALLCSPIAVPVKLDAESRQHFYEEVRRAMDGASQAGEAGPLNLLQAIDESFKAELRKISHPEIGPLLCNEFCRFLDVDRQLFLVQIGSAFESTDTVRVLRFSPQDAQRGMSKGPVESKVCGKALHSFGGFFKAGWRANDIMIGRFDAVCQLLECLLSRDRLSEVAGRRGKRGVTAAQIAEAFPRLAVDHAQALTAALNACLDNPKQCSDEDWDALLDRLVLAAQNEIYLDEWPRVVKCTIEQEYAWAEYRRKQGKPGAAYDAIRLAWESEKASPDKILVDVAANAIALGNLPPFEPGSIAGRGFLDEIPETVLEELGALATMRLGDSLLDSIHSPKVRQAVEGSPFYKWPFERIAKYVYVLAHMRRTKPESAIIFNTAIPAVCFAILLAEAIALWFLGLGPLLGHLRLWILMAVVPILVLVAWWVVLFPKKQRINASTQLAASASVGSKS